MLVNTDRQTWHLICWQHSHQPMRSHVRKSPSTNIEFNMSFSLWHGFYLVTPSPGHLGGHRQTCYPGWFTFRYMKWVINFVISYLFMHSCLFTSYIQYLLPPNGEGYVFIYVDWLVRLLVCLSVSNITGKLTHRFFFWNFQDILRKIQGIICKIWCVCVCLILCIHFLQENPCLWAT